MAKKEGKAKKVEVTREMLEALANEMNEVMALAPQIKFNRKMDDETLTGKIMEEADGQIYPTDFEEDPSTDSVRITAMVGRDTTPPRPITAKRDSWLARGFPEADTARLKQVTIASVMLEKAAGHPSFTEKDLESALTEESR